MTKIIHIVPGRSAGISLKQALEITSKDMVIFDDHLASGPMLDFDKLEDWLDLRNSYWNELLHDPVRPEIKEVVWGDDSIPFSFSDSHQSLLVFQQAKEILLWIGTSLAEQLLLTWVIRLFQCYELDFAKLKLIEAYHLPRKNGGHEQIMGIGILNPDELKSFYEMGNKRSLVQEDLQELQRVWNAVTSSQPAEIVEYYQAKNPHFGNPPHFNRGYV